MSDGFTRMTITVPAGLKKRMDKAEGVNWSATAATAFEAKLTELDATRLKGQAMKDVIERLKAAKELEDNEDRQAGKEAGELWAKKDASPKQLQRLADVYAGGPLFHGRPDAYGWAGVLWNIITGSTDWDRQTIHDFWEHAVGDDWEKIYDEDFAEGFVIGATEVWHQVQDKL